MSYPAERADRSDGPDSVSGAEALGRSSAFRGPVDPPEDHSHSNDHFALVYEGRDEQFDAAVPFVRQGLERGERCLYVADENSRETVLAAMRARGIDVDGALESDALTVRTSRDTYLADGEFDRDEMLAFWEDSLAEATDADEFTGIRAAAEMTWALDSDTSLDLLTEYEAMLNDLYEGEEYAVLCQYNRDRFPAAVIRDVVRTHPYLVHGDVVSDNVYYTPPAEFFGPERPANEVDRMIGTLRERTEMKTELAERQRFLREQYEIVASPDRSFEEKLQALFDLGCERFDLELGGMARIDHDDDLFEVEVVSGDHDHLEPGSRVELSETYCRVLDTDGETTGITDPTEEGFEDTLAYDEFGVHSYLGTRIGLDDVDDRTFFFVSSEPRAEPFTEEERTFHHLMGQWVKYELERRERERTLEETVDRLRQSNDRLTQFAYAASHDLQEPLRMVSSYLQLLENEYGDDLDADATEYIDFAVDGADRMRAMVEDLLAFSRVEQSDGAFEPVDIEAVVDRVLEDLEGRMDDAGAAVAVASLPSVRGDREQLEQLFRNLVSNAVKYNESETPRVEITAERRADRWEFSVSDNGIGIDPEKTDRIFEVFKRLHHDDEYPGTGIGLSLCQEIVDNHGGDIRVDSEPGEGSTFSFTIPRRTGE